MKKKRRRAKPSGSPPVSRQKKRAIPETFDEVVEQMGFLDFAEAREFIELAAGMSMADLNAALGPAFEDLTKEEKADEYFLKAMEATTRSYCRRKLLKALRYDPDHVRALAALAFFEEKPEQVEKKLRHAIAAGERKLGSLLEEERGQLWGFVEARPYMEARAELAKFLSDTDRLKRPSRSISACSN